MFGLFFVELTNSCRLIVAFVIHWFLPFAYARGLGKNAQGFCQSGDWSPRRFMRPVHEKTDFV